MPHVHALLVARVINRSTRITVALRSDVSNGAQEEEAAEDDHRIRAGRRTSPYRISELIFHRETQPLLFMRDNIRTLCAAVH